MKSRGRAPKHAPGAASPGAASPSLFGHFLQRAVRLTDTGDCRRSCVCKRWLRQQTCETEEKAVCMFTSILYKIHMKVLTGPAAVG